MFKNIKIRSFNDIKYLTTNEGTTIHQNQDIYDINMDFEDISLSLNISEGKCISAKLKRELSCIACNACIKGIYSIRRHQLHVTVRIYANVCTSCTFVVTVNKTNC